MNIHSLKTFMLLMFYDIILYQVLTFHKSFQSVIFLFVDSTTIEYTIQAG